MSSNPYRYAKHSRPGSRIDWVAWHEEYDSPSGSLRRRLERVRRRLGEILDGVRQPATVLSLFAGDGRDLLGADLRNPPARAVLVELEPELARRAAAEARGCDWAEVRCGDATDRAVFDDVVPVDVLMACGIPGNVNPDEVGEIVDRFAALLKPGGTVIWTSGGGDPDLRDDVRAVFVERGFDELAFDGSDDVFGVGVSQLTRPAPEWDPSVPLLTFVP